MANRPVYVPMTRAPFYQEWNVEFTYNAGLSTAQKQRNIEAIHSAFLKRKSDAVPLEISSKSLTPLGVKLSAFNLKKHLPSLNIDIPVENAYQGGKKFKFGGPYTDLYQISPKEAKNDERLKNSGAMTAYVFEDAEYPLEPKNGFYDWIYIQALCENKEFMEEITKYNAFTDVEFNPNKSINCQARAAAIFVGIAKAGLLDQIRDFYDFCKLITGKNAVASPVQAAQVVKPVTEPAPVAITFSEGQVIHHPAFGEGKVSGITGDYLKIQFECGEKIIGEKWARENCTF